MFACCAFAVFLLSQILAPFAYVRDRLFGAPPTRPSAAVVWSPDNRTEPVVAATARRLRPAIAGLLAFEVLAVGVSAAAAAIVVWTPQAASTPELIGDLHVALCHAIGRPLS